MFYTFYTAAATPGTYKYQFDYKQYFDIISTVHRVITTLGLETESPICRRPN